MRLKRMGKKRNPIYRIVVADSRAPRDGRFIEEVGTYDPNQSRGSALAPASFIMRSAG